MSTLFLPVKRIYFEQIQSGIKGDEFRLVTPYWEKRLIDRNYAFVEVMLGYPSLLDFTKRLRFPWQGYTRIRKTHPHFGLHEVEVFAIHLYDSATWKQAA